MFKLLKPESGALRRPVPGPLRPYYELWANNVYRENFM